MRAAMYYANDDVRIVELPKPRIGPGEILVRVKASGICGSDVMEWYRKPKAPPVLGHEIAAEVVEVGAGVDAAKVGDRVFVSHHVPCGSCRYCRAGHETVCDTLRTTSFDPGGFAEYVRVPPINVKHGVFPLPREISDDEGTFIEPLACVIRGQRLAGFRPGSTLLVLGSGVAGGSHDDVFVRRKPAGHPRIDQLAPGETARGLGSDYACPAVGQGRRGIPTRRTGPGLDQSRDATLRGDVTPP